MYNGAVKHLNRYVGAASISKLRTADIQDVISDLARHNPNTGKPTATETLKTIKSAASQIFRLAIENRVMEYNPGDVVRIPSQEETAKHRALTKKEQSWVEGFQHRAQTAAMIMTHAGLRRGEVIPLTWNDIDLNARTIAVSKSVEVIKSHFEVKRSLKSEASFRVVDIPQKLVTYLKGLPKTGVLVCPNREGGIHTQSSWVRMWDTYLLDLNIAYGEFGPFQKKKSGEPFKSKYDPEGVPFVIPRITPHWLRHTFATNLYLAGVDVMAAKEQLGHASINTTLGIYTHLDAVHKRRSMSKLDKYLGKAKPK